MAVYREGYHALETIKELEQQVFSDAADTGAPVDRKDNVWVSIMQLYDMYGEKKTRAEETKDSFSFNFTLIDEWAVSDERKTMQQAIEKYKLTYTKLAGYQRKPYLNPAFKGMHGFVTINKIS